LVRELLRPYELTNGAKVGVSASLGVSLYPTDAGDAATLMEHADKAMYTAKKAGKNAYCLFSSGNGNNKPPAAPSSVKIPIGPQSTGIPPGTTRQ
jgi:predicted signal transduction protein with EAL and GGDEF domain